MQARSPNPSILVDLDPASGDRTVIVESITADRNGMLYLPDRVTGNILRVDPKSPKPIVVGRIEAREIKGKKVNADPSGIAFNAQGDLFVAVGPFAEVVRIRASEVNQGKPGVAQTFATGTSGANGLAFDRLGNLWVTANERNALITVTPEGTVREVAKNGSQGPLEFPAALVFVGDAAYIANFDTPRRDNMDANGKTALDGTGASIARITP